MKEKVDIEIASECNNHIKSSHQIKGLSWSLSPDTNCLCRVVSNTWSRAAWDQQKDFFHFSDDLWPCATVRLLSSYALSQCPSQAHCEENVWVGRPGKRQRVCVPVPCCHSTFCPKSFSLTSISSLLRAGESWQERVALSSVAPIFPVALYPRYRVRCPESNLGAHLHWVWDWAQVPGDSLGLLTSSSHLFFSIFPSFAILKLRSDANPTLLIPVARESWWLQPARTFRALLKTVLNYLAYSRHRRE